MSQRQPEPNTQTPVANEYVSGQITSQIKGMENQASAMMKDLENVMGKLKDVAQGKAGEVSEASVKAMADQMKNLRQNLDSLANQSSKVFDQIDRSVRANPYIYIAGAVGVGILLGKALRS